MKIAVKLAQIFAAFLFTAMVSGLAVSLPQNSALAFSATRESQLARGFRGQRIPNSGKLSEDELIAKVQTLPKDKLRTYKMDAAKQLQANLIKAFQGLSANNELVPVKVRASAKTCLKAAQSGKFTTAIFNNLPIIIQQTSQQQNQPAQQLQTVLTQLIPTAPVPTQGALQGLLDFVSANLSGVNTLLGKLVGGAPDLLGAVVKSLSNNLGAVTDALNGSLASLGTLLG